VSLDVDGTLYDLKTLRWRVALRMPGQISFIRNFSKVREKLRQRGEVVPDFRAAQRDLLAAWLNQPADKIGARIDQVMYRRLPAVYSKARPYADVREVLTELSERGIVLAVLSDYPSEDKLAGLGLADLPFEAIISGEAAGALKPHPASFEQLSSQISIEAAQILHVGDREDCDVDGALAAGCQAARFAPAGGQSRARVVFSRWDQFLERVARAQQ
jgi:FMN phosphatase YigB (HAD superfamily)